ncbi:hypothetical protein [Glaciibacter sp. 2TAF33]|uniref:hypothetical protein n=1 Tax=Glaciibacter sp. 2TAF33 TaxID=3233015 RepID=UPI003F92670B
MSGDRNAVPAFLRISLYALLIVGAALSVPSIGTYSPLPVETLLDAWIIAFMVTYLVRGSIRTTGLLLLLGGYSLTRIIPALASESPMVDFFQAYRWLLYLVAFAFAVGRTWGPARSLVRLMWILLGLALAKTALTLLTLGPGARSGLLTENNFEIALFSGLVAVLYSRLTDRSRFWAMLLLGVLVLTSGSRSGAIAYAILVVYVILQAKSANLFVRYLLACTLPVLVIALVQVFESRAQNGGIDRLNFLNVFLGETQAWNVLTWLFGTAPITPLSSGGCGRLSFYVNLFSSTGDGHCYSVIFHAFVMRVAFDAGIVGLIIAFSVTWYTLRRSNVELGLSATLLLLAFTNGLSVSGLNNPYVALPILLAIATATGTSIVELPAYDTRTKRRTPESVR